MDDFDQEESYHSIPLSGAYLDCGKAQSRDLLEAVRADRVQVVASLLNLGANPNLIDAEGFNALHHAAALGSRTVAKLLVATGRCDYLMTTVEGGLRASELAERWTGDRALARWLRIKEARQAQTQALALIGRSRYGPVPI